MVCLLIDDDPEDQEIFMMALEEVTAEIECVTANDGPEALRKLQQEDFFPEYIFLDMNMPRMDGIQCLTEIRKIPRLAEVPVVIYSTSAERRDILATKQLGATFFMTKTPNLPALIHQLNNFF